MKPSLLSKPSRSSRSKNDLNKKRFSGAPLRIETSRPGCHEAPLKKGGLKRGGGKGGLARGGSRGKFEEGVDI